MAERAKAIDHGILLALSRRTLGDKIKDDTAAGAFLLQVSDAGDFRKGQTVRVSGFDTEYAITDASCRGNTISIDPALAQPADGGDPVIVWDKTAKKASKVLLAKVATDDADGGDVVTVPVTEAAGRGLKTGIRKPGEGEPVRLLRDGDDHLLLDAPGKDNGGGGDGSIEIGWETPSVTDTNPSTGRLISTASAGTITRIVSAADTGTPAMSLTVNGTEATTFTVGTAKDVSIAVSAGDLVRIAAAATGAVNVCVIAVIDRT